MTIKEKPLIDAVSNLGALPGFLFQNMFFLGAFSMAMGAVFGAFTFNFFNLVAGIPSALDVYESTWVGGFYAMIVTLIFAVIYMNSQPKDTVEEQGRRQYLCGAILFFTVSTIVITLANNHITAYLERFRVYMNQGTALATANMLSLPSYFSSSL